ncbi:hypothetical protein [Clostridium sp. DL1XJH146]
MKNYIIFTLPAMLISYFIFDFIFNKINIKKHINTTKKRLISYLFLLSLATLTFHITNNFDATKDYGDVIIGIIAGPLVAVAGQTTPKKNSQNYSL